MLRWLRYGWIRYVRITLPEGVRQSGSEFQLLQAQFEKILIDRGMLKEGEGPNERTVTLPFATAIHVLGSTEAVLARGDLALSTVNAAEKPDPGVVLTLTVGDAAFPLHRTTVFGTLAESDRMYAFKPELNNGPSGIGEGLVTLRILPGALLTN
jgi:hypothetical protein